MISLGDLLLSLVDAVPLEAGGADDGVLVEVDTIELSVPVEARLRGGAFQATVPRGRVATGFDTPTGTLEVCFAWRDGAP